MVLQKQVHSRTGRLGREQLGGALLKEMRYVFILNQLRVLTKLVSYLNDRTFVKADLDTPNHPTLQCKFLEGKTFLNHLYIWTIRPRGWHLADIQYYQVITKF